ncbi:MAG: RNA polymerase sigma factor [Pseudonocardiaceae bacterium]
MTTATINYVPPDAVNSVADLLLGVSHGDPASWDEVLRRYGKLVFAAVRPFRLQKADALDAVQMTWLRLAENAHRVQFPERLGGWLVTTARRECLHILRQAKAAPDLIDVGAGTVADPSMGPERHVINADTTRIVWKLVDELPSRQRTVLRTLFTDSPPTYAEAARVVRIPPGGIGPTRARALRQLRDKLDEHGVGSDAWR